MFEKILYKMVIISPYILLALSFISLILGIVKKSLKDNADVIWNVDVSMNDLYKENKMKNDFLSNLSVFSL